MAAEAMALSPIASADRRRRRRAAGPPLEPAASPRPRSAPPAPPPRPPAPAAPPPRPWSPPLAPDLVRHRDDQLELGLLVVGGEGVALGGGGEAALARQADLGERQGRRRLPAP